MYKETICYQTFDGNLFIEESKAIEHSEDLLGEQLDVLIRLAIPNIDRSLNYRAAMTLLSKENRESLKELNWKIHQLLNFKESY